MNIIVLLAGRSSRFKKYYNTPKHLIDIKKKTMIRAAVESIKIKATYIFVVLENKFIRETVKEINKLKVKKRIFKIKNITRGPAESAYFVTKTLNLNSELMIINCDQIMNWNPVYFLNHVRKFDGGVVTYYEQTKANSYALVSENLLVKKIKEKKVISNISLNGIHYWKKNKFFNESFIKMKSKNEKINNEYYIAPTYNYMIKNNLKVTIYHIPNEQHNSVGSYVDLKKYLKKSK